MEINSEHITQNRIPCKISGCVSSFLQLTEMLRHVDEEHGDKFTCPEPGCHYPGTRRPARLREHLKRNHPEFSEIEKRVKKVTLDQPIDMSEPSSTLVASESGPSSPKYETKIYETQSELSDVLLKEIPSTFSNLVSLTTQSESRQFHNALYPEISNYLENKRNRIKRDLDVLDYESLDGQKPDISSPSPTQHLIKSSSIQEHGLAQICNDSPDLVGSSSLVDSSNTATCYLGIGEWARQIAQNLPKSLVIDFSAAKVEAALDVKGDAGISQCAGASSSSHSIRTASRSRTSGSVREFGSRIHLKSPYRNENEEDEDDPRRSKQAKVQRFSNPVLRKKLACLYYKNQRTSSKHPTCTSKGFQDIARVKEHLYRSHLPRANPCPRCGVGFKTLTQLNSHLRSNPCLLKPEEPCDGLTMEMHVKLKSRKKHGRDPSFEERWFDIYHLIFSDDPPPADPYQDQCIYDGGKSFSERELPPLYEGELETIIQEFVPNVEAAELLKSRILSHLGFLNSNHPDDNGSAASISHRSNSERTEIFLDAPKPHDFMNNIDPSSNLHTENNIYHQEVLPMSTFHSTPNTTMPHLALPQNFFHGNFTTRRTASGESWADSGYGSGICGNLDCSSTVGCVQCVKLWPFERHPILTRLNSNEFTANHPPLLPMEISTHIYGGSMLPMTSAADMDAFLNQPFFEDTENSRALDPSLV